MKKLIVISILVITGIWYQSQKVDAAGVVCFKKGEKTDGMNKICYYNCMGSEAAITIDATEICPITINR